MHIEIADIHFLLSCSEMPLCLKTYSSTYGPFITKTNTSGEGHVPINVSIETIAFPGTGQLTKIFDTMELWSMFRYGEDEYLWVDATEASPREPICMARFKRRPENVTVYCGNQFISETNGKKTVNSPIGHPLDQILVMYVLAEMEGAILHACAIELDGKGYILPGRSGAGKTTLSRLFAADGHKLLSDDRVVARKINGGFYAFGTPWAGDAEIAENRKLPLHGIFFIRQSSENRIEKIVPLEAAKRLMPLTSIPWFDEKTLPGILSFCEDLVMNIPVYELHFRPDIGAVKLLEEFAARP